MDNKIAITRRISLVLAACLTVLLLCSAAMAQTMSLRAPTIANDNGALKARFGVQVKEKPILMQELEDGHVLVLKCAVELFEVSDYWFDSTVSEASFESTISYDRLSREYSLILPGRPSPMRSKDLSKLLHDGWSSIETTLGPWNMLEDGEEYSLRLITTMNEKDAPEGLMRILYFWSWDAGSDNTFHLNFRF